MGKNNKSETNWPITQNDAFWGNLSSPVNNKYDRDFVISTMGFDVLAKLLRDQPHILTSG